MDELIKRENFTAEEPGSNLNHTGIFLALNTSLQMETSRLRDILLDIQNETRERQEQYESRLSEVNDVV